MGGSAWATAKATGRLAWTIAEGKPYEYGPEHARVFRTPGYPLLLAPILRLAGDGQSAVLLARAEAALLGAWPWPACGGSRGCCSTTARH